MPHARGQRRSLAMILAVLGTLAIAFGGPASTFAGVSANGLAHRTVDLQLLSFNDFHGNLLPPSGSSGRILTPDGNVDAGGVTYLASTLDTLRQDATNSITVSVGDNIGASPLISGYFHDEPTIQALNLLHLDYSSVGNHEFDEGPAELLRMQDGGCLESSADPKTSCPDGAPTFTGADFQYLSANVVVDATGNTLFPPYAIRNVDGVRVAFIGVTLEGTPGIVTPSGTAGLTFLPEAQTINKYVDMLERKARVETFVVLLHQGAYQATGPGYINDCGDISGDAVNIVGQLSSRVDVVLTGHTHTAFNCTIPNSAGHEMVVTGASSFGRVVTDVELKIDRATGDVYNATANNVIVRRTITPDAAEDQLVGTYSGLIADVNNAVVGSITANITRTQNAAGESALGDVVADSQLEGTAAGFGTQIAIMNPGGIRADLTCPSAGGCDMTFGDLFAVEPFGNDMWIKDLTGDQLKRLLEQQATTGKVLQISEGLTYTWSASAPLDSKVSNLQLDGVPIDAATTYTVAGNAFLMAGGDGFGVLAEQASFTVGMVDLDTLVSYFAANSPVTPGGQDRITLVP